MHRTPTPSEQAESNKDLAEAVAKGYEPHDLKLRAVFVFIAGLSITLVVVLAFIYAVMMALAEHDRSGDPIGSPVMVKLPPVYAPLQPSLGFNGEAENNHDVLDQDDMVLMLAKTQAALISDGITATGRHHISIDAAIDKVLPLLVVKPVEVTQ